MSGGWGGLGAGGERPCEGQWGHCSGIGPSGTSPGQRHAASGDPARPQKSQPDTRPVTPCHHHRYRVSEDASPAESTAPECVDMSGTDLLGALCALAATPNGVICNTCDRRSSCQPFGPTRAGFACVPGLVGNTIGGSFASRVMPCWSPE